MSSYRIQEADLDIPDAWQDQSINIFKLPAVNGAQEASFVISRDRSQGDTPFADYVANQLNAAEQQLPEFKLIKRWDFDMHGHAAVLLDYSWKREGRELLLRQVFVERKPAVLITTLTTTANDLAQHEPAWKQAMQSLKPQPSQG
ncbi:DcrB-related protein [Pseudomonas sp. NFXW11]|uniref:DcrB-related protein n=1 Tax=Pseudomonas sp. NFXW11 TaxID=2819531 RepID=UPI003CF00E41